jgi:hypothetical protein
VSTDTAAWERLFHAYGVARAAPAYLAALRRGDLADVTADSADYYPAKGVPYSYLWAALYRDVIQLLLTAARNPEETRQAFGSMYLPQLAGHLTEAVAQAAVQRAADLHH